MTMTITMSTHTSSSPGPSPEPEPPLLLESPPSTLARNNTVAIPSSFSTSTLASASASRRGSDSLAPIPTMMPTAVANPNLNLATMHMDTHMHTHSHSEFVIEGASESQFDVSSSSDDDHDDDDHDDGYLVASGSGSAGGTVRPVNHVHRSHSRTSRTSHTSQWSTSSSASSFVSIASHASWAPPPAPPTPSPSAAATSLPSPPPTADSLLKQQPSTPTIIVTDPSPSKSNTKPASKPASTSTSTRAHTHTHSASVSSSGTATSLSFTASHIPAHPNNTPRGSILSTSTHHSHSHSHSHSRLPSGATTTPSATPHMASSALADPAGVWRPDVARDTALALHECSIRAFALVHDAHWPMHPLPVPVPRGKPPSQAWMNPCPLVRMGTLDGTPAKFSVVWKPVRRPVSPARALNPVNWGSHSVYVKEGQREVKVPEVTMFRRKLKPVGDAGSAKAKSVRSRSASRGRSPDRSPRPVSMIMLDANAPPMPDLPPHSGGGLPITKSTSSSSSSSPPPNWFKRTARKVFSASSSGASSPTSTHTSPGKSPAAATAAGVLLASAPPRTVSPSRMAPLTGGGDETDCDDSVVADAGEEDETATLANSTTIRAQVEVPGTPADILHLILDRPAWDAKCVGWDVVFESHFHTTRQYHFSDGIPPTQFVEVTSFKSSSIILSAMALPDLAPTHLTLPHPLPSSSSSSSTHSTHAWVPTPTSTSALQSLTLGWVLEPCVSDPGLTRVSLYVHARGPEARGRRRTPFTRSPASIARRAATQVAGWLEQVAVRAVCVHVVKEKQKQKQKEAKGSPVGEGQAEQGEDTAKARGATTDSGIALSLGPSLLPGSAAGGDGPEALQTATLNRRESSRAHAATAAAAAAAPPRRLLRSMSDGNLAWLARARFESHHAPLAAPASASEIGAAGEWIIRPVDPSMVPTSPITPTAPASASTPAAAALRDRAQLALVHARRLPGPGGSSKWIAESVALLAGMMRAGWSAVTARLWWGKATHGTTMAGAAANAEHTQKRGAPGKAGKLKVKTRGRAVSDVGGGGATHARASVATSVPESTVSEVGAGAAVEPRSL